MIIVFGNCPSCRYNFSAGLGANSGLGSSRYRCRSCNTRFQSTRSEWLEMGIGGKLWYCLISTLYVVFIGAIGGMFLRDVLVRLSIIDAATASRSLLGPISIGVGIAIAGLQCSRLVLSIRRSKGLDRADLRAGFLSWQTNLQGLVVIGFAAIGLVDRAIAWLMR